MISPDGPIENPEDDLLGRTPLAGQIAKLVVSYKGKQSYVIGIESPWGSGKTSFINLVLQQVDSASVRIIKFDPWFFSNQDELIGDFFAELNKVVREELPTQTEKTKRFGDYVKKLTKNAKISFEPEITIPVLGKIKINAEKKLEETLREGRKEIETILSEIPKKILIVIDNVDRLDPEDALAVFKLVKLTGDFPNTVFLVAFDRDAVSRGLKSKNIDGEEYLKKIIQVPFVLPVPDRQEVWDILASDLNKTLQGLYGSDDLGVGEEGRWGEIFRSGFGALFKTLRDTKRYISSLQLNWSIVDKNDINKIDFIAIEAIRIIAPEFYNAMRENKDLFTGSLRLLLGLSKKDDEATRKKKYADLLSIIEKKDIRDAVDGICQELFPLLQSNVSYSDSSQTEWEREKRICASERFEFYFKLGIPKGAVSETEVDALIKTMSKQKQFEQNLLNLKKSGKLKNILRKLLTHVRKVDDKKAQILAVSLWNQERAMIEPDAGGFDLDGFEHQSSRIIYQVLKKAPKKDRLELLKEILSKTTGFALPGEFVLRLEEMNKKQSPDSLFTEEEVKTIVEMWKEKARDVIEKEDFIGMPLLGFTLFRIKRWLSDDDAKKVVEKLLKTSEGIGVLLSGFLQKVYSSRKNYYQFDRNSLGELYPLEEIETKVKAIPEKDKKAMSDRTREAIKLFLNPPKEGWFPEEDEDN